ncbi:hypothetical protein P7C71_g6530, partial [Lecanoromycetidae sp. Uapishka_2]
MSVSLFRFRDQMPRPIIGIGHSVGALQLVNLSIMHPRLLTSLILIEPMIQKAPPPGPNAAMLSTLRRDIWPTEAAARSLLGKKIFGSWEPRAFDRLIRYGLRKTPTAVYPDSTDEFTLTTTKHQEAWTFLRSNFTPQQASGSEDQRTERIDRLLIPDVNPTTAGPLLFHRAEAAITEANLPIVRPSVFYIFGGQSILSPPSGQKLKLETTGVGIGGSGGVKTGQVSSILFPRAGHLLPFERIAECAEAVSGWLGTRLAQFSADEAFIKEYDSGKSKRNMLVVSEKWKRLVREPADARRPVKGKL